MWTSLGSEDRLEDTSLALMTDDEWQKGDNKAMENVENSEEEGLEETE